MKLSEYIAALQALQAQHGDHEVVQSLPYAPFGAFHRRVWPPAFAQVKVKSPRESYEKIVGSSGEDTSTGEVVYRL